MSDPCKKKHIGLIAVFGCYDPVVLKPPKILKIDSSLHICWLPKKQHDIKWYMFLRAMLDKCLIN